METAKLKFEYSALARMRGYLEMWNFAFSTHTTINHIKEKTLLMKKLFLWKAMKLRDTTDSNLRLVKQVSSFFYIRLLVLFIFFESPCDTVKM